jgi:S-adenosylmethionine synthetase
MERLGAYFARYVAKNLVAAGLAEECEVLLSYTVGQSNPVSIQIETFGTGKVSDKKLLDYCRQCFDFRVGAILHTFALHTLPAATKGDVFRKLACYGHMGRTDLEVPWEAANQCNNLAGVGR